MQVKKSIISDTEVTLTVLPTATELKSIKDHTLSHFQSSSKIQGFREGKAPLEIVEKNVDQNRLQQEFLEEAINQLYPQAVRSEKLRPVAQPEVSIKKFVPFTELEFEAKINILGEVVLVDYKKIKLEKKPVTITSEDVQGVIKSLQTRMATQKEVTRAAKSGDQVLIDFKGFDAKGQPVRGADGKDYPLILGSKTFIPGFEENIIGTKPATTIKFDVTFPADYGVKALANRKVTFEVQVKKVEELKLPKVDDEFAQKAGPFKTVAELKKDIKNQLTIERERQAGNEYESELVRLVTSKSKVVMPDMLVDDQVERMLQELKQNLVYRGQTYAEYLENQGKSEEEFLKEIRPEAEERVKASLVLAEIAEKENLDVTPEELEVRIQVLKGQHQDAAMQGELDKPENRRDIAMRMLSEKTVAVLAVHATAKK